MRTIFVVFIVALLFVSVAHCEQKYNPHESTWDWDSGHNPSGD